MLRPVCADSCVDGAVQRNISSVLAKSLFCRTKSSDNPEGAMTPLPVVFSIVLVAGPEKVVDDKSGDFTTVHTKNLVGFVNVELA